MSSFRWWWEDNVFWFFFCLHSCEGINASNLRGGETSEACFIKNAKSKETSFWRENHITNILIHLHFHPWCTRWRSSDIKTLISFHIFYPAAKTFKRRKNKVYSSYSFPRGEEIFNLYSEANAWSLLERLCAGGRWIWRCSLRWHENTASPSCNKRLNTQSELLLLTSGPTQRVCSRWVVFLTQAVVGETRDKFHLLEQTFSFLFDLFIQHVHYHHDCLQALHRTPEPDPEQALTVKKEELRGRQSRADGQNEEKTLCNCGGLETWRWRSRPTGSEVIAAVAMTRFLFLNILFYWKLFCICRYVNKLSVTFLLHFLHRLLQLFGASLVFEATLGTNPPLVLPVSSGSLPSVGLHEKRHPYKNHIEFLTFLYRISYIF